MNAAWLDRASVALIVLASGAYLARMAARRVASAFRPPAAGACGTRCECDASAEAPDYPGRPVRSQ